MSSVSTGTNPATLPPPPAMPTGPPMLNVPMLPPVQIQGAQMQQQQQQQPPAILLSPPSFSQSFSQASSYSFKTWTFSIPSEPYSPSFFSPESLELLSWDPRYVYENKENQDPNAFLLDCTRKIKAWISNTASNLMELRDNKKLWESLLAQNGYSYLKEAMAFARSLSWINTRNPTTEQEWRLILSLVRPEYSAKGEQGKAKSIYARLKTINSMVIQELENMEQDKLKEEERFEKKASRLLNDVIATQLKRHTSHLDNRLDTEREWYIKRNKKITELSDGLNLFVRAQKDHVPLKTKTRVYTGQTLDRMVDQKKNHLKERKAFYQQQIDKIEAYNHRDEQWIKWLTALKKDQDERQEMLDLNEGVISEWAQHMVSADPITAQRITKALVETFDLDVQHFIQSKILEEQEEQKDLETQRQKEEREFQQAQERSERKKARDKKKALWEQEEKEKQRREKIEQKKRSKARLLEQQAQKAEDEIRKLSERAEKIREEQRRILNKGKRIREEEEYEDEEEESEM